MNGENLREEVTLDQKEFWTDQMSLISLGALALTALVSYVKFG